MRAIIQAGGKGTRLRNVTKDEIPKPMVPILGKPLLQWQIEKLKEYGITDIFIIIGYLGVAIKSYFGNGGRFGVRVTYIEEQEPLGTGGGLYYLKDIVGEDESIFLIYGDVFFDIDFNRMIKFHNEKQAVITAFVHPNSHPDDSDLLEINDEHEITGILSKHEERNDWYQNLVNAAFYIVNGSVINKMGCLQKLDFERDILQRYIISEERVFGYKSTEYIKDAGTEERLNEIGKNIKSGLVEKRNLRNTQKCIFLDRDGTLNRKNGLIETAEKLELMEGIAEAIRKINSSEYLAICITNQPVVARGMCSIEDVEYIHKKLQTLLGLAGAYLDDIKFCPHHPDKGYPEENPLYKVNCNCRKPAIGMIEEMAERYNISLADSWMIGDTTTDIQTGINAGMHTALVLTGEAGMDGKYQVSSELTGSSLDGIIGKILNHIDK
jgi:histidinol-phosphate phosphatase family protein